MKDERRVEETERDGVMERGRRESLLDEARSTASELDHLMRRARHEAPEVHSRLRTALEALQLVRLRVPLRARDPLVHGPARHCVQGRPDVELLLCSPWPQ